jgi:NADP-dependent aldehyde dehydrogenase
MVAILTPRTRSTARGPVLNFAASNFLFAFSVAGGDTASALAAGCPVIVKSHSGHPRLSAQTARIVAAALEGAGAPAGTLQLIAGRDAGVAMLRDPRVAAGSFTGSIRAGRMLADIAAARPRPVPFFGELGSVNPTFMTAAALSEGAQQIADGFVVSVSGSAGQLCTKPGFLFVPFGHDLDGRLAAKVATVARTPAALPGIERSYRDRRDTILGAGCVTIISEGSIRFDEDEQGWATPTIVRVSAKDPVEQRALLLDEAFGPLSILVEYDSDDDLAEVAGQLFEGNLTGTVHAAAGEDSAPLRALTHWLAQHSGRAL